MSTTVIPRTAAEARTAPAREQQLGPIGRLGRYTATRFRRVLAVWVVVALVLGFFAPRVENALSGAGWEANGSQSVLVRLLLLPVLLALMGARAWYLPAWARRVLPDVRFGHS